MQRILLPVDGSEGANHAARFAGRLARDTGVAVTLLYVYDAPTSAMLGMRHADAAEMARVRDQVSRGSFDAARAELGDVKALDTHVAVGHPVDEICAYAEQLRPDLVVVGARGKTNVRERLLGSVSERVARHAPCPVTIVR